MPKSARSVVERSVELFNRDAGQGKLPAADSRALWAPEPVIIPFRAALEGIEYRGPNALDEFAADSFDSWSRMRLEAGEFREIDEELVLMLGFLVGWGRETGLEMRAPIAILFVVRDGLIAEARTYASEADALAAVER